MSISTINNFLSLAFAPLFVLSLRFVSFEKASSIFAIVLLIYLLVSLKTKQSLKVIGVPAVYFIFVVLAYYFSSMELIKMIPALISASFFALFLNAFLQKHSIVLRMMQTFYKKELSAERKEFIAKSDGYWSAVLLLNTLIQIFFIFYPNELVWAFYSSVGWYLLLFTALILQIVYGEIFLFRSKKNS